jgi:hypothetical protein
LNANQPQEPLPPYTRNNLPAEFFYWAWTTTGTLPPGRVTGDTQTVDRTIALEAAIEGAYLPGAASTPANKMLFVR